MNILVWIGSILLGIMVVYVLAIVAFANYVNNPATHDATPVDSHTSKQYHVQEDKVIYVMGGNFFSIGGTEIEGADIASFEVIDESYAKDINSIYYNGRVVKGGSPSSVEFVVSELSENGANSGYLISGGKVFCFGEVIDGADPDSFSFILGAYAMDKDYIYHFYDSKIPREAVPTAILNASDGYIRHADQVIYEGNVISQQATSFQIIDDEYSKDSLHLFSHGGVLEGVDPSSFVILSPYFRKDKNKAYYFNHLIVGSDPDSFEVLNDAISKDKNNLYYNDYVIKNKKASQLTKSDADEFTNWDKWRTLHLDESTVILVPSDEIVSISYYFFVYKSEVYTTDKKLEGVKPEEVIVLGNEDDDKLFARIGNKIFYMSNEIVGADSDTFTIVSEQFTKDVNHVYWLDHKVVDADPATFKYEDNLYADENKSGEYVLKKSESSPFG
ncbi:MAG: hypothetical protein GY787_08010 [Alteromonadales bacterium]|nr:hypothetical protein [Alteromonadales bacterium]